MTRHKSKYRMISMSISDTIFTFSAIFIAVLLTSVSMFSHNAIGQIGTKKSGAAVYVIAESVSTNIEAHSIIQRKGWKEVPLRQADYALVVVRSMLWDPLRWNYDSISDLRKDASYQMNISGENFIVYLYRLDEELKPTEETKVDYPARD